MADGDTNQGAEIISFIDKYATNAKFFGCGWHIVDRGWLRHRPCTRYFKDQDTIKKVINFYQILKNWMYSFMKPGMYFFLII